MQKEKKRKGEGRGGVCTHTHTLGAVVGGVEIHDMIVTPCFDSLAIRQSL